MTGSNGRSAFASLPETPFPAPASRNIWRLARKIRRCDSRSRAIRAKADCGGPKDWRGVLRSDSLTLFESLGDSSSRWVVWARIRGVQLSRVVMATEKGRNQSPRRAIETRQREAEILGRAQGTRCCAAAVGRM